ncbi:MULTISPECIES: hypothetical protein [unclassified Cyanobium]|uniref:hypothetical protein n=1 Tax=unclassified Cyanobium TaxID=2627006 RepID=UPI0020CE8207|nr:MULTISPECIES: hypothetical protein [unclassified Cyanobium]MCP9861286.1 hypothetical protein [Cyanobium sp. Cruz-8H5]MCP9868534.1 hypothetical protein [Cyanobium sp. Cruz-8D1]
MGSPHVRSNGAAMPRPQLPAFCRSRRPVVTVSVSSLIALRLLVLLGLLFQLSTLLVVIAGPVPPRPVISSSHDFRPDAVSSAAGVPLLQPLSDR